MIGDNSEFPLVTGQEIFGEISVIGTEVKCLKTGDKVGMRWFSSSCIHCIECMGGKQHCCSVAYGTLVGRHGGFGDYVKRAMV